MPHRTLIGIDFFYANIKQTIQIFLAEGDFLPLRDGGLDTIYIQINALICGFGTAVDVEMPFQKGCIAGSHEREKPFNQCLALSGRYEPG